jgi:hypothetical protein
VTADARLLNVESEAADCELYPEPRRYFFELRDTVGVVPLGSIEADRFGAFRVELQVPQLTPSAGDAEILIRGTVFDECQDNGSADCEVYSVSVPTPEESGL